MQPLIAVCAALALGCASSRAAREAEGPSKVSQADQPSPQIGFRPMGAAPLPGALAGPGEWRLTERGWVWVAAGRSLDEPAHAGGPRPARR
jgi:hypothetical protein